MIRGMSSLFVLAVFLGATLGFQIQPIISSVILPWFGGSPAVWTVCLLFFQTVLFAGYYYAFRIIRLFDTRGQLAIHTLMMLIGLCVPVMPSSWWRPQSDQSPILAILWLLASHVGIPFLILSSTAPLLQVWYLRAFPGRSPYWLYACSNTGSFLGLVSVPFFLESWFSSTEQVNLWYGCWVVFCALIVVCGIIVVWLERTSTGEKAAMNAGKIPGRAHAKSKNESGNGETSLNIKVVWFLLSMIPTVLLAAITSRLTTDVSPVPFLWVLTLTIYLLTLVISFSSEKLAARRFWVPTSFAFTLASGAILCLQSRVVFLQNLPLQFLIHLGTLTAICMMCHGELARRKPNLTEADELSDICLTNYYLVMSLGGAAGGFFTAVIAPLVFPMYLEHHLGLLAAAVLAELVILREKHPEPRKQFALVLRLSTYAGLLVLIGLLAGDVYLTWQGSVQIQRSFFGVNRLVERRAPNIPLPYAVALVNGTTEHGVQFTHPQRAKLPTTYFSPTSGVGIALLTDRPERKRKVGVVGLGAGTLAAYGHAGDRFDFYEIDPVVIDFAQSFFRYLSDCPAQVSVIPGDARLSLEKSDPADRYDFLVLDAFTSDAIPIHLLTAEAFEVYRSRLADDGLIAAHISSRHFDLRPVLAGHARRWNWSAICLIDRTVTPEYLSMPSVWVLMSPRRQALEELETPATTTLPMNDSIDWTDDRHSLMHVLLREFGENPHIPPR